jgi:hypothetical protein
MGNPTEKAAAAPPATKPNRFVAVYGRILFTPITGNNPLKDFGNGTIQHRLNRAMVEMGHGTDAFMDGCSVVRRVSHGGKHKEYLFQFPSSSRGGGEFHDRLIKPNTEAAKTALAEWCSTVAIAAWREYRLNEKALGHTDAREFGGVVLTDEDEAALGVTITPDDAQPAPPAAIPTATAAVNA